MARREGLAGSFWPSERQELLLRAALFKDERGQEAWRTLRRDLDIQQLEKGSTVLLPLLYEQLTERGVAEAFLPRLKGVYRYTWYRNQVGLDTLRRMLDALRDRGLATIVLGDAALILNYYRRLGVRPLDEPAVLVHPNQLAAAFGALADAGWKLAPGGSGGHRVFAPDRLQASVQTAVRLRYALYWRPLIELGSAKDAGSGDPFWRARQEIEARGARTSTLSTTHELLRTCLGGARSGGNILWIADAKTILDGSGSQVDWRQLLSEARRLRCVLRLRDALAFLADTLDAPIPEAVREQLDAIPNTGRERLAHQISGRGGHLLGSLPATVAAHVVASQNESLLRIALTLPRFLRMEWGLDHVWQVPAAAVRRGASAISAARPSRHAPMS